MNFLDFTQKTTSQNYKSLLERFIKQIVKYKILSVKTKYQVFSCLSIFRQSNYFCLSKFENMYRLQFSATLKLVKEHYYKH